jgi:hypothetical protein
LLSAEDGIGAFRSAGSISSVDEGAESTDVGGGSVSTSSGAASKRTGPILGSDLKDGVACGATGDVADPKKAAEHAECNDVITPVTDANINPLTGKPKTIGDLRREQEELESERKQKLREAMTEGDMDTVHALLKKQDSSSVFVDEIDEKIEQIEKERMQMEMSEKSEVAGTQSSAKTSGKQSAKQTRGNPKQDTAAEDTTSSTALATTTSALTSRGGNDVGSPQYNPFNLPISGQARNDFLADPKNVRRFEAECYFPPFTNLVANIRETHTLERLTILALKERDFRVNLHKKQQKGTNSMDELAAWKITKGEVIWIRIFCDSHIARCTTMDFIEITDRLSPSKIGDSIHDSQLSPRRPRQVPRAGFEGRRLGAGIVRRHSSRRR